MILNTINSERLKLRQLTIADAEDVFEFTSMSEVTEFLSWNKHSSVDTTKSFLTNVISGYDSDQGSQWGIELVNENKIIGITGFISINNIHEKAEIAYLMSPKYGGKGYMTEANLMVLDYCFSTLKLNRVQAKAEEKNKGSQKVLEKIGMAKEGTFEDFLKVKGTHRTYYYYSILRKNTQWK